MILEATAAMLLAIKAQAFELRPRLLHPALVRVDARRLLGREAAQTARRYLGVPYVWGGASPRGFDCSGLVQYAYGRVGVRLPRTTWGQRFAGRAVSLRALLPGDLLFSNAFTHVGIYVGSGLVVSAPHTGAFVHLGSLSSFGWIDQARRIV